MMQPRPYLLSEGPAIPAACKRRIEAGYERIAEHGLPRDWVERVAADFEVDLTAEYAGFRLSNPFGKASGQLSMTARQVEEDVEAGLGFVVLKTVIAQDAAGQQTMAAWAVRESRMVTEPIVGRSGERGWTVSWKGRGWWQSFDEYLQLIRDAREAAAGTPTLIVPSCKFHLPAPDETTWNAEEYAWTTPRLLAAWRRDDDPPQLPMPLEKDFSPTLAGSDRATAEKRILNWLQTVPRLVREAVHPGQHESRASPVRIGLKIFNALFDDDFQLAMLRAIHTAGDDQPDFYVYANRLFDPERVFDGHRGIAYGGPDLSDRNLRVMSRLHDAVVRGEIERPLPWSATGNITTGRMALEYALRGATSFQLHTFFQLPAEVYHMRMGSKVQKALCELLMHPQTGLVPWMHHLAALLELPRKPVRFLDLVGQAHRLPSWNLVVANS